MLAAGSRQGQLGPLHGGRRREEVLVALAAVLLYLPTLSYGFVFDDLALLGFGGRPLAVGDTLPYRPLRLASYWLDWLAGGAPAVFHAHNVALHAAVSALAVALAKALGARALAAAAGGLLVAVHPVAVEAAAYVSGRRDLLCVLLGSAALLLELRGRRAAALASLVLSASAKESGLVFAVALLALRLAPARRSGIASALACIAAAILGVLAYGAIGPWAPAPDWTGAALAGRTALHYAASLVWPVGLAPEYPELLGFARRLGEGDRWLFALPSLVAAFALAAAVVAASARLLGERRGDGRDARAFAACWLATTAAALAIWGGLHEPGADRHAYLLLVPLGVALALMLTPSPWRIEGDASGAALGAAPRPALRGASGAAVAAAIVLCGFALATRGQMSVWRSEAALWSYAVEVAPRSVRARHNFAAVLAAEGDLAGAERQLARIVARGRAGSETFLARAALRCATGRASIGRFDLRRARRAGASGEALAALEAECASALARGGDGPSQGRSQHAGGRPELEPSAGSPAS